MWPELEGFLSKGKGYNTHTQSYVLLVTGGKIWLSCPHTILASCYKSTCSWMLLFVKDLQLTSRGEANKDMCLDKPNYQS